MNGKDVIGAMFILILVYLLVYNATGSSKVLQALAEGTTATVKALQGR